MSLWNNLKEYFSPLPVIARELTAIRELYEADLCERDKPIVRITEQPSRGDTEVFYGDGETKAERKRSTLKRLLGESLDEPEEEYVSPNPFE